jgi:hypothetical protein
VRQVPDFVDPTYRCKFARQAHNCLSLIFGH